MLYGVPGEKAMTLSPGCYLMMVMAVRITITMSIVFFDILLGVRVEGFSTACRAEVVGLSLILRFTSSGFDLDFHTAYRVNSTVCHVLFPFLIQFELYHTSALDAGFSATSVAW